MNEEQIKTIISGYLADDQAGLSKENPKLDFKARWYDLKDNSDINEFLKDTSAIANTPGLDGFVVIGYDEKTKVFDDAYFSQSNLKDSNELVGLLIKRVDRAYNVICYDLEIDGHKLSVLHVPPSFDKPHVIKSYQKKTNTPIEHRVFIRNGSTTRVATKYDLDFMAYDRKNNTPEYALFLSSSKSSLQLSHDHAQSVLLNASIVIENSGLRPVAIKELTLTFYYVDQVITYTSRDNRDERFNTLIDVSNLIIHPFEIKSFTALTFVSKEKLTPTEFRLLQNNTNFEVVQATIKLNNGRLMQTNLEI
jgi:hypothetical protein